MLSAMDVAKISSIRRLRSSGSSMGNMTSTRRFRLRDIQSAEAERELAQHGGKALRPWSGGKDWETLGWSPGSSVRGAYWVEVSADGRDFIVHGLCDVDGDGRYAEYQASSERTATWGRTMMSVKWGGAPVPSTRRPMAELW